MKVKLSKETMQALKLATELMYKEPLEDFDDNVAQMEILDKLREAHYLMLKYNKRRRAR